MLPRRSEQARAMVLSELRRTNPAADIDRAYMGTGNTTITKAGGSEQGEKSAFQTPFFDGSRNGMSEQDEKRNANYDKVRRFLAEAETVANKSHADAKNSGRSHGQSERKPSIVLSKLFCLS